MEFGFTEEEIKALEYKVFHSKEDVICLRCGKMLRYREVGSSSEVVCEAEGCIQASLRGL